MYINSLRPRDKMEKILNRLSEDFGYSVNLKALDKEKAKRIFERARADAEKFDMYSKAGARARLIKESMQLFMQSTLTESDSADLDEAEIILAAREMSDTIQGVLEDIAKLQVQTLLSVADVMRKDIGQNEAEAFETKVDAALSTVIESLKGARTEIEDAISIVQGNAPASNDMEDFGSDDLDMDSEESPDFEINDDVPEDDLDSMDVDSDESLDDIEVGRELK